MENTPVVCANDLPTILGILKNNLKSRSVNILSSNWIFTQTVKRISLTSQSSAQLQGNSLASHEAPMAAPERKCRGKSRSSNAFNSVLCPGQSDG